MTSRPPAERPAVAQFVRSFLPPTETFIYAQLTALREFRPVVLTRARANADRFPWAGEIHSAEGLTGRSAAVASAAGRLRVMSRPERQFFRRALERSRSVLLHAHFGTNARYVLPALGGRELPLIASFYGYDASSFPRRFGGLGARYLTAMFARADLVLALSEDMRSDLVALGSPPARTRVHHFGIEPRAFPFAPRRSPESVFRVCWVGRFVEKKGALDLVDAVGRLRARRPDLALRVTMLGDGPLRELVVRRVAERGLDHLLELPGFAPRDQVEAALARSHLFVLPSRVAPNGDKEGTPTVVMEAMASGLPVLASAHAGLPEMIREGESGFLVPEADPEALAAGIGRALDASGRWPEIGAAARRTVELEFNAEVQARRLEALYAELLAR